MPNRRTRSVLFGVCLVVIVALTLLATTGAALALPSGWAYELVSQPNTNNVDVTLGEGAADGNHAWVTGLTPLQGNQATGNIDSFAVTRTSSGWETHDLSDPAAPGTLSAGVALTSRDASATLLEVCEYRAVACQGPVSFQRVGSDGSRTTLLTTAPSIPVGAPDYDVVDGSPDLTSIIFQVPQGEPALLPVDTHTQGRGLYRSDRGTLEYLALDEHGNVLPCGAALASNPPGRSVGAGFEQDGISTDAQTVVFASPDPLMAGSGAPCSHPVDLYVRRAGQTVDISAPRNVNPDEGATYEGNSRDGNTVFFVSASRLTADDTDDVSDLYAYDLASDTLTRLTPGANIFTGFGRPSVVVAPDGNSIYFVALNAIGGQGTEGAQNLFRYHDGVIDLIASAGEGFIGIGQSMSAQFPSPLTPDGRHMVFFSSAPLTGQPLGGTFQLFDYDAEATTRAISCISCPPDGSTPTQRPSLPNPAEVATHMQSDDGSTVIFETDAALLAQDRNGVADAYLWHDGSLSLLSSGHSSEPSTALSISADGHTAFFLTLERLTPDTLQDAVKLYAARLGGGFPQAVPRGECSQDACQGPPTTPPTFVAAASDAVSAVGNLLATPSSAPTFKAPSRAQRLAKALKACGKNPKKARKRCESTARRRFGKKSSRSGSAL